MKVTPIPHLLVFGPALMVCSWVAAAQSPSVAAPSAVPGLHLPMAPAPELSARLAKVVSEYDLPGSLADQIDDLRSVYARDSRAEQRLALAALVQPRSEILRALAEAGVSPGAAARLASWADKAQRFKEKIPRLAGVMADAARDAAAPNLGTGPLGRIVNPIIESWAKPSNAVLPRPMAAPATGLARRAPAPAKAMPAPAQHFAAPAVPLPPVPRMVKPVTNAALKFGLMGTSSRRWLLALNAVMLFYPMRILAWMPIGLAIMRVVATQRGTVARRSAVRDAALTTIWIFLLFFVAAHADAVYSILNG